MSKSPKTPPPPDYAGLAQQQAGLNKEAFEYQTRANRPNQSNPYGTSTWSQDAQGNWSQSEQFSPEYQKLFDQQTQQQQQLGGMAGGMLGGVQQAMGQPMDTSGMTDIRGWQGTAAPDTSQMEGWGNIDFSDNAALADSGFGGVEAVQKAMMSRLQPGLEQGNAAEIARLKAQGITEGSPAWQAAMQSQGQRMNDASQQALLGSMGAYGDIFNRSLQARQQGVGEEMSAAQYANSLRGQQFGEGKSMYDIGNQRELLAREADTADRARQMAEAEAARYRPLQEYQALRGAAGGAPELGFNSFFNQGNAGAADMYGAAEKDYQARLDAANAAAKKKGGMMSGIGTMGGAIIGGIYGGPAGAAAGASAGGALGSAIG